MKNVHATVSESGRALVQWRVDDFPIPYALTELGARYRIDDLDAQCLWEPGAPEPFPLLVDVDDDGRSVIRDAFAAASDPLMHRPVFASELEATTQVVK